MTDSKKEVDYIKAQELLPWYAKGELLPEESQWVSNQIDHNSSLKAELALILKQISITKNYINRLETEEYNNKPARLSALMDKIHSQERNEEIKISNQPKEFNNKAKKQSLWGKLLSILPQTQSSWQKMGALALGVMIVQTVMISQLYQPKGLQYTTLSGEDSNQPSKLDDRLILLTKFNLGSTMNDVETLLTEYNLSIISGPDASGIYRLATNEKLTEESRSKIISELEAYEKIIMFIAQEN